MNFFKENGWYMFYLICGGAIITFQNIVIETIKKDCASFKDPKKLGKTDWRYDYLTFMNYALIILGAWIIAYSTYQKFALNSDDIFYDFSELRDVRIHAIQAVIGVLLIMYGSIMFDVARNYCDSKQKWRNPVMMTVAGLSLAFGVYLLFNIYWVRRPGHKTKSDLKREKVKKLRKDLESEDWEIRELLEKAEKEKEQEAETEWEKEHRRETLRKELEEFEGDTTAQRQRKKQLIDKFDTGTKTDTLEKQIEKLFESGSGSGGGRGRTTTGIPSVGVGYQFGGIRGR